MTTTKKNAPAMEGKSKHFDLYSTRLALLLVGLSATSAVGVAMLCVLAWRLLGGAP